MSRFIHIDPSLDAFWRAIILFGRNSASYKFALGKTLIQFAQEGRSAVSLEELAGPFSKHICAHLKTSDRQGTSANSRFLAACRAHMKGDLDQDQLMAETVRRGFANVIDAFHVVGQGEVGQRFFEDDRRGKGGGIILTENLLSLSQLESPGILTAETEARWRLVETSWNLGVAANLLDVGVDSGLERLVVPQSPLGRVDVTSARDALNGYQKGKCFYCFSPLSSAPIDERFVEVDHFFPISLSPSFQGDINLNGVWNLVLSCAICNAGEGGKFARIAALRYLERLERRNNYLINSHHPLRDTLRRQTGFSKGQRQSFLQSVDAHAVAALGLKEEARWVPASELREVF